MKRKYFTEEEVKAARKRRQDAYRAKRAAAGMCLDCGASVENRRICEKCCRKSTIRKHIAGKFKTYQLGSKLSPERPKYWLHLIKCTNPLLRENWSECVSWLEKHFELYVEHEDRILHNYSPLRLDGDDSEGKAESVLNCATLEDLVVAKIDLERELQKCPKVDL